MTTEEKQRAAEKRREYMKEYRKKNREALNAYHREYIKEYRKTAKGKQADLMYWYRKALKEQELAKTTP